eukprot:scaffold52043_cov47-Attheya_sp.AAC.2
MSSQSETTVNHHDDTGGGGGGGISTMCTSPVRITYTTKTRRTTNGRLDSMSSDELDRMEQKLRMDLHDVVVVRIRNKSGSGDLRGHHFSLDGSCHRPIITNDEGLKCVICQTQNKSVVLIPCRHMCLCWECCSVSSEEYQGIVGNMLKTCPLCRTEIKQRLRVFI